MPTLLDLLTTKRAESLTSLTDLTTLAADAGRAMTDEEETLADGIRDSIDSLDEKLVKLSKDASRAASPISAVLTPELPAVEPESVPQAVPAVTRSAMSGTSLVPASQPIVKVTEPLTYSARGHHSFFVDLYNYQRGEKEPSKRMPGVEQRMRRHQEEHATITRAIGPSTNFAGLVTPQYLTDMTAEGLYNGRQTSMYCLRFGLPDVGTSIHIPRFTTKASTAVQATEGTAVETSSPAVTDLTITMATVAGQIDVSRQSLDRGTMVDSFLKYELDNAYNSDINEQVLEGTGTGNVTGILKSTNVTTQTWTEGTPTAAKLWKQLGIAVTTIANERKKSADLIVMHPQTWAALYWAVDTDGRPLFQNQLATAVNVMGIGDPTFRDAKMPMIVGAVQGIPVVTDPGIPISTATGTNDPTNEAWIIVARREDLLLFEQSQGPTLATYDEVLAAKLSVKLVQHGYIFFTCDRQPKGIVVIKGTGTTIKLS